MADDYLSRVGKAVARGVPQMATGFVDLAGLPFTMTGLLEPEEVFGSTAYLTEKGLLPPPQTGLLNETIEIGSSMLNPSNAVNAGIIGLGGVIKNLGKGQKVFYHVTDPSNVNKITKEGIIPNKSNKGYTKSQAGGILSEKDKVYAFDNYNDALRWQSNSSYMESDPAKTAQIIPFVDDASKYVKDAHPEYGDYLGVFKKEGSVSPDQLLGVEFTQPIAKKSAGKNVGEFTTDDLSKYNQSIPYLRDARMLNASQANNPYATKYNTDLNTPTNFWQSKGMTQRPLNEEDYGILLSKGNDAQAYTSAATSINKDKLPAVFTKLTKEAKFAPGSRNIDIGGGKFDNASEHLAKQDVENLVFDPYNRSADHNRMVLESVRGKPADTATVSNVLNVIPDEANQIKTLETAYKSLKDNGEVFITVYEGNKSGVGKVTGSDQFQQNKKLSGYLDTVRKVFPNATVKGGMIRATK